MKLLTGTKSHISLDRSELMKVRRMTVGADFRQSFSKICRNSWYLTGLANLHVLVNKTHIFPNFKEEINV
jgi:hypothetical protein